jgi:NADPH:quinone reductase-like Zn-dependent oxidoreductase
MSRLVRSQRLTVLMVTPNRANLATLRALIESGKVRPVLERTYQLDRTRDAIRHMEVEHARAKIAICVFDSGG